MNIPNFLVVGAAKSGTTSLANYLRQHPQIFIPDFKEPHYFCNATWGGVPFINDLVSYQTLFEEVTNEIAVGECSTGYLYYSEAPAMIKNALPDCKIIIMLRSPVDRAFSMYCHNIRDTVEKLRFEDALSEERIALRYVNGHHYSYNYIQLGFVSDLIHEYIRLFGKQNVFIRTFEEFKADTLAVLKDIYKFLVVDPNFKIKSIPIYNASGLPQFKMLNEILNNNDAWIRKKIRKPIRAFLSEKKRHLLWDRIRFWNISISGKRLKLNPTTRAMLLSEFSVEIGKIEEILEKKLPEWRI